MELHQVYGNHLGIRVFLKLGKDTQSILYRNEGNRGKRLSLAKNISFRGINNEIRIRNLTKIEKSWNY